MAYVTVAQVEAGTAQAGAALLLRAPAPLAQPGVAARALQRRLRAVADGTARRLKTGAQAAYQAYPTLVGGFQAVSTTQGGRVAVGLAHTGKTVAGANGPIPLIDLIDGGSVAHTITPRDPGGWLIWHDAKGWHKVKEVRHPGFRGLHRLPALFAAEEVRFAAAITAAGWEALTDGV